MLRIRLRRVGKKKQPMYRIVVADSRAPRDGAFVEAIGIYHPLENPSKIEINAERAKMWLEKGAQPSDRVAKLLVIQSILPELPAKLRARIELIQSRPKPAKEEAPAAPAAVAPTPAPVPAPAAEVPAAVEVPAAEETPAVVETPAVEEASAAEQAPAAEETPAAEATAEPTE
jgi:small subunit ribosomal protein S16